VSQDSTTSEHPVLYAQSPIGVSSPTIMTSKSPLNISKDEDSSESNSAFESRERDVRSPSMLNCAVVSVLKDAHDNETGSTTSLMMSI
jgi:hypothetical protein